MPVLKEAGFIMRTSTQWPEGYRPAAPLRAMVAMLAGLAILSACGHKPPTYRPVSLPLAKHATPESMTRVADSVYASGDYAAALQLYRRQVESEPGRIAAQLGLARTLRALGAHQQALEVYETALKLDATSVAARLGKANSLIALRRPVAAARILEKLVVDAPDNADVYNSLGVTEDLQGEFQKAQVTYGKGLDLRPADHALKSNLALSFALSGDFETAIALMRGLAREPGAGPKLRQNLAMIYGLAGRLGEARAIAAMDLPPPAVANNMALYQRIQDLPPSQRAAAALLGPDFSHRQRAEDAPPGLPPLVLAPEAAPEAVTPAAGGVAARPVRLELRSFSSRAQALVAWERYRRIYSALFAGMEPKVSERPAEGPEREGQDGKRFVLGAAMMARPAEAAARCDKLLEKGIGCHIVDGASARN